MRCSLVIERRFINRKHALYFLILSLYLIIFKMFRTSLKIRIGLPALQDKSRSDQFTGKLPIKKFAFMKNHKCASSTIDSIIFRFAEKNNLNLVLPAAGNYLSRTTLFDSRSLNNTKWKDVNFDIFCLHNRWNRKEVMKVLREETVPTFTVVRDAVDVFVSMFHFQDGFKEFYGAEDIHDMINKIRNNSQEWILSQRWNGIIGRNQMAWDMGLSPDIYDDEDAMKIEIERLDDEFDLVMITERMEESLVLLRYLLKWTADDVVHLNLNRRKLEKSPKLTFDERQVLVQWLKADDQIYKYFLRRFDEKVSQYNNIHGSISDLFGDEPIKKELTFLEDANKQLYNSCVLQEVGNEKLQGEYKWFNDNVMGFIINEKDSQCASFARSELAYLDIFENILYSRIQKLYKLRE